MTDHFDVHEVCAIGFDRMQTFVVPFMYSSVKSTFVNRMSIYIIGCIIHVKALLNGRS